MGKVTQIVHYPTEWNPMMVLWIQIGPSWTWQTSWYLPLHLILEHYPKSVKGKQQKCMEFLSTCYNSQKANVRSWQSLQGMYNTPLRYLLSYNYNYANRQIYLHLRQIFHNLFKKFSPSLNILRIGSFSTPEGKILAWNLATIIVDWGNCIYLYNEIPLH